MKTASTLVFAFTLSTALLHAQAVPDLISYQGKVVDVAGVGLGTGTPVNRKILFRLFNAGTGGILQWSEEQTVTLSNGDFSVILGQGVRASYNGSPEVILQTSLLNVFAGTDRYLEIVVDNGDGSFTNVDTPITPRQRLISTAYAVRASVADGITSGSSFNLKDANHGLGWYGTGRPFNGVALDGPVLYGFGGGALGSVNGASQNLALRWTNDGNVGIGTANPTAKLDVVGNAKVSGTVTAAGVTSSASVAAAGSVSANGSSGFVFNTVGDTDGGLFSPADGIVTFKTDGVERARINAIGNLGLGTTTPAHRLDVSGSIGVSGSILSAGNIQLAGEKVITLFDVNHGLGYYGSFSTAKPTFASVNVNGPVLYGWGGGALGSSDGGQKIAVQWDGSKNVTVGGNLTAAGAISTPGDIITGNYSGGDRFINVRTQGGNAYRSGIKFQHFDANYGWSLFSDERFTGGNGFHIDSIFAGAINTRLFIANDGKTGIGTKAPAEMLEVSGNIKATGNVTASGKTVAVGEESLRIVRGTVNANGTIALGQGFTVSGTNPYTITFATAFNGIPSITATSAQSGYLINTVNTITANGFILQSRLSDNNQFSPGPFSFIVAGPR